ncbi:MAG TPA: hypothetical protein VLA92_05260 [Candidatus Saccharimonadales bacterium]|nr:hypothetical protein [Candidatus Saccharimonadales bacterium]
MDFVGLLASLLDATDTLVQVVATLYVAVAIFAGEQISSTFNGDSAPIRLKAKRYVEYLYLPQAVICAISLPLLANLQTANIFPDWNPSVAIKPTLLALACMALVALLVWATFQTFLQTRIHKKYSKITDPQTRLIAWALDEEKDPIEENKMIVSILSRENDYDFELVLLKKLEASLKEVLRTKDRTRAISLVGSLRVLRRNIDNRPIEQPEYFELLFDISHTYWLEALHMRSELHERKIYQLSSTLGKIGRELMSSSLGKRSLAYDYFNHLEPFIEASGEARKEYFAQTGSNLLIETSRSPESTMIWTDYFPDSWRLTTKNASKSANYPAKLLFAQYARLVNRVQREDTELEALMDDITMHLFPDIHTGLWSDLMVLRYQYWPGTTAEEHLRYWIKHPKKFGFITYGTTVDFNIKDRPKRVQKTFNDLEQATIDLAATLNLFSPPELEELIAACKKLNHIRALTPDDLEILVLANLEEVEQTLTALLKRAKKHK